MLKYIVRRVIYMIPTLILISMISFVIIQLPPGDFLTTLVSQFSAQGEAVDRAQLEALESRYGLDQPFYVQYWKWISNIIFHGDFGESFEWNRPVSELLAERLPLTIALAVGTLLFTWAVSLPVGIYSAVRQYSVGDYVITFLGFLGIAIPNFLLALVIAYISFKYFGQSVIGLYSPEFVDAEWNLGKLLDLLAHIWVPVFVLGAAGMAGIIRIVRAVLLDALNRRYVTAARSKGVRERELLIKYPLRVAVNPFVSSVGWVLPLLRSGEVIVAEVLGLQAAGPLLLRALVGQDMYLAGS